MWAARIQFYHKYNTVKAIGWIRAIRMVRVIRRIRDNRVITPTKFIDIVRVGYA